MFHGIESESVGARCPHPIDTIIRHDFCDLGIIFEIQCGKKSVKPCGVGKLVESSYIMPTVGSRIAGNPIGMLR